MFEAEPIIVESEQTQDRGVEVVERMDVLNRPPSEFIGDAVTYARFHTRSGEPTGKAIRIVVAAFGSLLEERHPAEFRAPHHKRLLHESALFEVTDERCCRLVEDLSMYVVLLLQSVVPVPIQPAAACIRSVEELNETDALFDHATREYAVLCECGLVNVL